VSDFARLEPIVKFELTRLEGPEDLTELLRFEQGLACAKSLDEPLSALRGVGPDGRKSLRDDLSPPALRRPRHVV